MFFGKKKKSVMMNAHLDHAITIDRQDRYLLIRYRKADLGHNNAVDDRLDRISLVFRPAEVGHKGKLDGRHKSCFAFGLTVNSNSSMESAADGSIQEPSRVRWNLQQVVKAAKSDRANVSPQKGDTP